MILVPGLAQDLAQDLVFDLDQDLTLDLGQDLALDLAMDLAMDLDLDLVASLAATLETFRLFVDSSFPDHFILGVNRASSLALCLFYLTVRAGSTANVI